MIFGGGAIKRLVAVKNAQNEMNARHTRKRPPQFADANEEGVYRSVTQQSLVLCVFFMHRDSAYTSSPTHKDTGRWDELSSQRVPA